jgi:peptidoglycan/LPS O-acetylase OafA/YrhL
MRDGRLQGVKAVVERQQRMPSESNDDSRGLLRTRGALVLGESSYSIYLLREILLSLFFVDAAPLTGAASTQQLPLLLPALAIVLVVVTALTFPFIERPAIRIGARIVRYWTDRRLPRRFRRGVDVRVAAAVMPPERDDQVR